MKRIRIDHSKCSGCRHCEAACSLHHYGNEINPKKARVRIFDEGDIYFPVIAGPFVEAESASKSKVIIDGTEYDESSLGRASFPSRPWFKEPDTGNELKCDFCGDPSHPSCVKWCTTGALTLVNV